MAPNRDWGYLLDNMVSNVNGIGHALAVSGDGLKIAWSRGLPEELADQLSAFTSGLASLTQGAARLTNGGVVEQTVVEMSGGYVIVMAIDAKSILTVLAEKSCELGQVSYEMATLINQIGGVLAPDLREPQRA